MSIEKKLERNLREAVKKAGGLSIKMSALYFTGIPDRLLIFPGGRFIFVEVKDTGVKPRPVQIAVIERLRALGCIVLVIDSEEQIKNITEYYGV